jgi:hypothetical protein
MECSKCAKKMTLTRSELIKAEPKCECGKPVEGCVADDNVQARRITSGS